MRRTILASLAAVLALASVRPVTAEDFRAYDIEIVYPWARATPMEQTTGSVFMKLSNTGDITDRLLAATSPMAARVALVPARPVVIPPGETVFLGPETVRLDLLGLIAPLVEGTAVPLTLRFERGGAVEITAAVASADAVEPPPE